MKQNYILNLFYFWIPIAFIIIQVVLESILPRDVMSNSLSEDGPHELLQFFIMLLATLVSIYYFISSETNKNIVYKFWFGTAFVCCLYVTGEEISWGQHFLEWNTPDYWHRINDQQETNLHNTSSWFDQKPRLILMLGIVFGTLILPTVVSKNILKLPDILKTLIPEKSFSIIAFLIIGTHLLEKILSFLDIDFFARYSEVQEIMLFYFVLLYLINLYHKLSYNEKP